MAMQININEPVSYTPDEAAAAEGYALTTGIGWDFDWYTVPVPAGTTLERKLFSGTPTETGTWELQIEEYNGQGNTVRYVPWTLTVVDPNAAPEPEPEPAVSRIVLRLLGFLGVPVTEQAATLAQHHVDVVTVFVRNYTRGNGFADDEPNKDLEAVIISATARYMPNPQQLTRQTIGSQSVGYATLDGFTLAEQGVLHRYRRRTSSAALGTAVVGGVNYATVEYVDAAVAGEAVGGVDLSSYVTADELEPYALRADIPAPVDLSPYALKTQVPEPVDLSLYALKTDIPAAPDLSPYLTDSELSGALTPYVTETELGTTLEPYALKTDIPEGGGGSTEDSGVRRSAQYTLASNTTITLPDADVLRSGAITVEVSGISPGPLWLLVHREGGSNRCQELVPPVDFGTGAQWRVGGISNPNGGNYRVWVDTNAAGAPLMFQNTTSFTRTLRVYWHEI